jgi:hypothetical protein
VLSHAYQQLRGRYDRYVAWRIDRACKGSDTVVEEREANSDGRNFCFELSMACWLASSGLELNCDDQADIGGKIADHYLIVECKRVRSDRKVETRGREAVQRLTERLESPDQPNMVGAVAFDFTPIANPRGVLFAGPNLDSPGLCRIGEDLVQQFAGAHARHWHAWGHPDVVAVFNRVHLTGADTATPQDATLQQLTFQGMHRLHDDDSQHSGFLNDLNQLFRRRGAALLSAEKRLDSRSDARPAAPTAPLLRTQWDAAFLADADGCGATGPADLARFLNRNVDAVFPITYDLRKYSRGD